MRLKISDVGKGGGARREIGRVHKQTSGFDSTIDLERKTLGRVRLQLQIRSGGFKTELIWSFNLIWRCLSGQSGDFLIWSSFRSATASNSHALPYIVVELELLASDQSGAFFSRSIIKSNLQLCSCVCPPCPYRYRPYRRQYYCSCRPYTMSS